MRQSLPDVTEGFIPTTTPVFEYRPKSRGLRQHRSFDQAAEDFFALPLFVSRFPALVRAGIED